MPALVPNLKCSPDLLSRANYNGTIRMTNRSDFPQRHSTPHKNGHPGHYAATSASTAEPQAPDFSAESPQGRSLASSSLAFPWIIFWVGLVLRLAYMTFAHTWRINPLDNHFEFGYEMGRVARSLITGHGYGSPFWGNTGPTAWVPPLYPWLLAADFKLFGVYTPLAAWVILAANCIFGAFTLPAVWQIARRCFNRKVAAWATWIWALYPAAMQYDVKWIWDMSLSCFLLSWVLVLALRMRGIGEPNEAKAEGATAGRWALFAVLWALIALSNPSIQVLLPACGLWILWGSPQWRRQLAYGAMAAVLFWGCLTPWIYRNWVVFHHFIPIRSDFGFELFDGNGPGATGMIREYDHPFQSPIQLRDYRKMGEVAWMHWHQQMADHYLAQHPWRFWQLTAKRIFMYWAGVPEPTSPKWWNALFRSLNFGFSSVVGLLGLALALRRKIEARWLFFWALALLPLTYYMITVHARFRHPMEPLIDILGVYLFQSAAKSWKVRSLFRHG